LFKGTFGFLWFFAWMYFAHDTPREHPTISKEELEYIETTVGEEQDHLTPKGQVCTGSEICGGLIVLGGGGCCTRLCPLVGFGQQQG
jgi:hypothetical protein